MNWQARCGATLLAIVASVGIAHASELQPFKATYDVYIDGKVQGESEMSLIEESPGLWLHTVEAKGTRGLARMSGFAATQTTRFREVNSRPQMQSAMSRSELLIRSREINTTFDWKSGFARWEGDLKDDRRRRPTPLTDNAVNAGLLNLLLALDGAKAEPSAVLRYRLFDRGSADDVDYLVGKPEAVKVPAGTFDAVSLLGNRPSKNKIITAWYAAALPPTPVRLLQIEKDKPSYELRLRSVAR